MSSNRAEWLKDHQFKKGQSGNPAGRPKKPRLPENVANILATNSPAIMELACKEALGYPDKDGEPTQEPNIRVMNVLLDKITPSLKSVTVKDNSDLPTMVIIGNDASSEALAHITRNAHIVEHVMDDAPSLPPGKEPESGDLD